MSSKKQSAQQAVEKQARCENCGTEFNGKDHTRTKQPGQTAGEVMEVVTCPVCNFEFLAEVEEKEAPIFSREDFESKLREIIREANQGGVKVGDVIDTLRQELEFTVECAEPGSHYTVQIINLGQDISMKEPHPKVEDYREKLAKNNYSQ